jgi:hypothetical protein
MTYALTEVPKVAPDSGSRFYLPQTPAGWAADPGEQLGNAFSSLLGVRQASMKALAPEPVAIRLKLAERESSGEWVLRDRGEVVAVPSRQSERPGQRWSGMKGGELLDSFGLGGEAWRKAPDDAVFEALRVVCEAHDLSGRGWRELNDSVCRLIALRAGCEVAADSLPPVSTMARTVIG